MKEEIIPKSGGNKKAAAGFQMLMMDSDDDDDNMADSDVRKIEDEGLHLAFTTLKMFFDAWEFNS